MKSYLAKILLLTSFGFAQQAGAVDETCVPKAGGGWYCGPEVTAGDAAPLPRAERTSRPPLLLIDPRRFGEYGDESRVETPVEETPKASAAAPALVKSAAVPAVVKSAPAQPVSPTPKGKIVTIPAVNAEPGTRVATLADARSDSSSRGTSFTVQLAIASSTKGFDKLCSELKLARSSTRELPLKNGSFALLMGVFPTIEAARAAIPKAAKGAFARDIRALENL